MFDNKAKAIEWRRDSARTTGHPHAKSNLGTDLTPLTKFNSN